MELRSSYQRIDLDGDNDNDNDPEPDPVISPLQQTQAPIPVVISSSSASASSASGGGGLGGGSFEDTASCPSSSSLSIPAEKGGGEQNSSILTIKVLKGEQSKVITVPKQASVAQLKSLIEPAYSVPVPQQRLVYKGKPLRPDTDSLASFHLIEGSVLHLFPLPAQATPSATSDTTDTTSLYNIAYPRATSTHIPGIPPHLMRPVHFVAEVAQSIREVKMWCYILMITSAMDIFTNMSFLGSQGHAGRGLLDSVLNILQTIFSFVGLYVGQLGLRCTTTAEAEGIKHYVYSLTALAAMNIILKILWVVDVVLLAKKSLHEANEEDEEEEEARHDDGRNEPGKGGGQYTDDPSGDVQEMSDSSFMVYFSIQAVIMAGIAISMWIACVNRARSFQRVVRSYEGIANRA